MLDEVPFLLDRVFVAGDRFEAAGWQGAGLLRARAGSAEEALERGVLVVPCRGGTWISATPPLTVPDEVIDEALARLS